MLKLIDNNSATRNFSILLSYLPGKVRPVSGCSAYAWPLPYSNHQIVNYVTQD